MNVIASTDSKYIGTEIPDLKVGETFEFGDFTFHVAFKYVSDDGIITLGNSNYQLEVI